MDKLYVSNGMLLLGQGLSRVYSQDTQQLSSISVYHAYVHLGVYL